MNVVDATDPSIIILPHAEIKLLFIVTQVMIQNHISTSLTSVLMTLQPATGEQSH